MYPILLHAFCSFSHFDQAKQLSRCLSHCLNISKGMAMWSNKVISNTKTTPPGAEKKKFKNCTAPSGFLWVPWWCPGGQPMGQHYDKCIPKVAPHTVPLET